LDACGLIAFLRNEPGADIIKEILLKSENQTDVITMHLVNFSEVYYDTLRTSGKIDADYLFQFIPSLGISFSSDFSNDFIQKLGKFKVEFKISFADSFALALAESTNGTLLTSDRHEFGKITDGVKIMFIR
jgi:PIN domain nuclease of toxin-antitoxin system